MQNFKQDDYLNTSQNEQRRREQQLIQKEMEKYLAMLSVEKVKEKSKKDDYIQPITPMTPKHNVEVKTSNETKDLAKAQEMNTESKTEENHYNIVYYNPELKEPEVIETTSRIEFQSIEQKVVEETLATRNQNIAMDYVFKDLVQQTIAVRPEVKQLQENKKNEELIRVKKELEVKPIEQKIDPVKISHSLQKRDELIVEVQKEIKQLEFAIEELNKAKTERDVKEKVLPKLPPLTRKRIEALMKKKMDKKLLLRLLIAEDFFLTKIKFLLLSIGPKEIKAALSSILRALRK